MTIDRRAGTFVVPAIFMPSLGDFLTERRKPDGRGHDGSYASSQASPQERMENAQRENR